MIIKISDLREMKNKVVNVDGEYYELIPHDNSYTLKPVGKEVTLEDCTSNHYVEVSKMLPFGVESYDKVTAINELIAVASHLNDGWKPDWSDYLKQKYRISILGDKVEYDPFTTLSAGFVYFKSIELAKEAVRILGEDKIKLIYS